MFEVGISVAIMIIAMAWAKRIMAGAPGHTGSKAAKFKATATAGSTARAAEPDPTRLKALEVYERLAQEKLEVIKTALAMGYTQEDLSRLDARLERLIGKDQLERIASGHAPAVSADLASTDLQAEVRQLQQLRSV